MKRKFLPFIVSLSVALAGFGSTSVAYAAAGGALQQDACQGLTQIDSSNDCSSGGSGVNKIASTAVNIISYITGIASVIMVLVGGFKYITSSGDAGKAGAAKMTIIYALVGIAVTVLAQFLVHFVINTSSDAAGNG